MYDINRIRNFRPSISKREAGVFCSFGARNCVSTWTKGEALPSEEGLSSINKNNHVFFRWCNKVKGSFLGCLILRKKKLELKFLLIIRPHHRLVRGGEGGGALIFFSVFLLPYLIVETRYFEETGNSYHDFFQHSYKKNLGSFTTTSSVPLEKEIQN